VYALTIRLTWSVQCIILPINIWGVKCDKVVDFPKSGHNYEIQGGSQDGRLMANFLIATIQVNLVPNPEKVTQIHLNCCY